jgi:hypothetical protein
MATWYAETATATEDYLLRADGLSLMASGMIQPNPARGHEPLAISTPQVVFRCS